MYDFGTIDISRQFDINLPCRHCGSHKMKERRKTNDRRVKPPKQGLPPYYTRHTSARRQNPISPEDIRVDDVDRDTASTGMTVNNAREAVES
jgi:hypothetical protein